MINYEERGSMQCFKIRMSLNGITIKTHGAFSSIYKDAYVRKYEDVGRVEFKNKVLMVGTTILKFDYVLVGQIIYILLQLGKTNPAALQPYIGNDDEEKDVMLISVSELEEYADKNRFAQKTEEPVEQQEPQRAEPPVQQIKQAPTPPQAPLPPPPPLFQFYAILEGKQEGPYDEQQFSRLVQYGLLNKDSMVWCEGMAEWQRASAVSQLSRFFGEHESGSMPPPPPPPMK